MRARLAAVLLALLLAPATAAAVCTPDPQASPAAATPPLAEPLRLAQSYAARLEPALAREDCAAVRQLKAQLSRLSGDPAQLRDSADQLANQLTLALANMQSADGLTVASAYLLLFDPGNPRASNLFGAVLHSSNRFQHAATVLEAAVRQGPGKNLLAKLNLANVELDLNRDAQARKRLEELLRLEPENREAHKALALYWLKQGNLAEFQRELLKAARFEGYSRRQQARADQIVDANELLPADGLAAIEAKLAQLKTSLPLTTADLIEPHFAKEAQQIRDRYGRLLADERLRLPRFPQLKTNSNRDYTENYPIVAEWQKVFADQYQRFVLAEQYAGRIDPDASEAANEAAARSIGQEQVQQALQQAQDQMKFLQGLGVAGQGTAASAMKQLQAVAGQQGVVLSNRAVSQENPPGWDAGSVFARDNYKNYLSISRAYETALRRYFADYRAKELDNVLVYSKKRAAAERNHLMITADLECEEPGQQSQIACLKETLRYKQELNQIGDLYYKLWVNLFIPQYSQKIKPMLEDYWAASALYIRNMNDPLVMQREYLRVKGAVLMQALTAAASAGIGASFVYEGSTEAEETALAAAIAAAEDEARLKQPQFVKEFQVPEKDWVDWIGDNLNFEVNGQFMSLKITARSLEFDAWVFGPAGGFKADFVDGTLDTYVAASGKFKLGIAIAGYDAKLGGDATFAKYVSHWDFENGRFSEGWDTPAAQAKVSLGPYLSAKGALAVDAQNNLVLSGNLKAEAGPLTAVAKIKVDSQLQAKYSGELSASSSLHGLQTPDVSLKF